MALHVLQNRSQIDHARQKMIENGLSTLDSPLHSFARRIRLAGGVAVGDRLKSWDVAATLDFIQSHLAKDAAIADIGCFASEVLIALHKAGYTNLTGIDLNERLDRMPHPESIRYRVADFTDTGLPAASLAAITSISVIEHGFDADKLLREVARLLQPGGYFIASFDYWPDKIDTEGIKFFGMSWLIFSREDVERLMERARAHGLVPAGQLSFGAAERPIDCGGKKYTFAHLVLRKQG